MPEERTGVATMRGIPLILLGPEIKEGDQAPIFSVLGKDLSPVSLSDSDGKVRVIASAPSLDTPVCADETRRLNQLALEHTDGLEVLTVSMDLPFALGRFCGTNDIENAKTLSDHRTATFGEAYGVLMKDVRLLSRAVFVLDGQGVVQYVQYVREVVDHPDYDAAHPSCRGLAIGSAPSVPTD